MLAKIIFAACVFVSTGLLLSEFPPDRCVVSFENDRLKLNNLCLEEENINGRNLANFVEESEYSFMDDPLKASNEADSIRLMQERKLQENVLSCEEWILNKEQELNETYLAMFAGNVVDLKEIGYNTDICQTFGTEKMGYKLGDWDGGGARRLSWAGSYAATCNTYCAGISPHYVMTVQGPDQTVGGAACSSDYNCAVDFSLFLVNKWKECIATWSNFNIALCTTMIQEELKVSTSNICYQATGTAYAHRYCIDNNVADYDFDNHQWAGVSGMLGCATYYDGYFIARMQECNAALYEYYMTGSVSGTWSGLPSPRAHWTVSDCEGIMGTQVVGWEYDMCYPSFVADKSYTLVKEGHECISGDGSLGHDRGSVDACAAACASSSGCKYFLYGTGSKTGRCYREYTSTRLCSEGWQSDLYNFYEMDSSRRLSESQPDLNSGGRRLGQRGWGYTSGKR